MRQVKTADRLIHQSAKPNMSLETKSDYALALIARTRLRRRVLKYVE